MSYPCGGCLSISLSPCPICPPYQLGPSGPILHFWGMTDFVHGFKVYFYGLVIAEFLFWGEGKGDSPFLLALLSRRLLCAAKRIYCDALVRAPLSPSSCCVEWTPLIPKRGGPLWPWGSLPPPCSPVSLFPSIPRPSPLCPLARLGVYARPLRHCGILVPLPQKSRLVPCEPW